MNLSYVDNNTESGFTGAVPFHFPRKTIFNTIFSRLHLEIDGYGIFDSNLSDNHFLFNYLDELFGEEETSDYPKMLNTYSMQTNVVADQKDRDLWRKSCYTSDKNDKIVFNETYKLFPFQTSSKVLKKLSKHHFKNIWIHPNAKINLILQKRENLASYLYYDACNMHKAIYDTATAANLDDLEKVRVQIISCTLNYTSYTPKSSELLDKFRLEKTYHYLSESPSYFSFCITPGQSQFELPVHLHPNVKYAYIFFRTSSQLVYDKSSKQICAPWFIMPDNITNLDILINDTSVLSENGGLKYPTNKELAYLQPSNQQYVFDLVKKGLWQNSDVKSIFPRLERESYVGVAQVIPLSLIEYNIPSNGCQLKIKANFSPAINAGWNLMIITSQVDHFVCHQISPNMYHWTKNE